MLNIVVFERFGCCQVCVTNCVFEYVLGLSAQNLHKIISQRMYFEISYNAAWLFNYIFINKMWSTRISGKTLEFLKKMGGIKDLICMLVLSVSLWIKRMRTSRFRDHLINPAVERRASRLHILLHKICEPRK